MLVLNKANWAHSLENHCHWTQSAAASQMPLYISCVHRFYETEHSSDFQKDSDNACWGLINLQFILLLEKKDIGLSLSKTNWSIQTLMSDRNTLRNTLGECRDINCYDDAFHGKSMVIILILHVQQQCGFVDTVGKCSWLAFLQFISFSYQKFSYQK